MTLREKILLAAMGAAVMGGGIQFGLSTLLPSPAPSGTDSSLQQARAVAGEVTARLQALPPALHPRLIAAPGPAQPVHPSGKRAAGRAAGGVRERRGPRLFRLCAGRKGSSRHHRRAGIRRGRHAPQYRRRDPVHRFRRRAPLFAVAERRVDPALLRGRHISRASQRTASPRPCGEWRILCDNGPFPSFASWPCSVCSRPAPPSKTKSRSSWITGSSSRRIRRAIRPHPPICAPSPA